MCDAIYDVRTFASPTNRKLTVNTGEAPIGTCSAPPNMDIPGMAYILPTYTPG